MEEYFAKLLKRFMPQIKAKAAPSIEGLLRSKLDEATTSLQDGESKADIIIEKAKDGKVSVYICAMSSHDEVLRIIEKWSMPELTEILLSNLEKIV